MVAKFSFEELDVWHKAIEFADRIINIAANIRSGHGHFRLIEQLEACSTSVALNIAEGKGRYSKKEFIQFLYIARGSLYETVTLLTLFRKNDLITDIEFEELKTFDNEIAKMLAGLINSIRNNISS